MKPQSVPTDGLLLFQAHFDQQLNLEHPLIKLAHQIDWEAFDRQFGEHYCEDNGAPAKPTRLMVGLIISSTRTTNRTSRWWPVGWRIRTGSTSAATHTCNTTARSIRRA